MVEREVEVVEVITQMTAHNSEEYTISKTIEELNELATVLSQYNNKREYPEKQPTQIAISDELGDVLIRVMSLIDYLKLEDMVADRMEYKLEKFKGYIEANKYKN